MFAQSLSYLEKEPNLRKFADMIPLFSMPSLILAGEDGIVAWLALSLSVTLAIWRVLDEWYLHRFSIRLQIETQFKAIRTVFDIPAEYDDFLCLFFHVGGRQVAVEYLEFRNERDEQLKGWSFVEDSTFTFTKRESPVKFTVDYLEIEQSEGVRAYVTYDGGKRRRSNCIKCSGLKGVHGIIQT